MSPFKTLLEAIAAKYAGCLPFHSAPLPSLSFVGNSSMIFPLLCPLSSFKIQTVSGCQLSCLWLPLCLLLSSKSFLSPLITGIVRALLRYLFPHLFCSCPRLLVWNWEGPLFVALSSCFLGMLAAGVFLRTGLVLASDIHCSDHGLEMLYCFIISSVAVWISHGAFSFFYNHEFCSQV